MLLDIEGSNDCRCGVRCGGNEMKGGGRRAKSQKPKAKSQKPRAESEGLTMDRRILFFLTESVWPSNVVPRKRTDDGLTTDRRILFFLTESVWPPSAVPYLPRASSISQERSFQLQFYFRGFALWYELKGGNGGGGGQALSVECGCGLCVR